MKRFYLALALLVALLAYLLPGVLFSPGPVHRVHADIANCVTCHAPFGKADEKGTCGQSGCHDTSRWQAKKGITRGHLYPTGCLKCHTEHKGADGSLTLMKAHEGIDERSQCETCHGTTLAHPKGNSQKCGGCHIPTAWKPAKIDHATLTVDDTCARCHAVPTTHTATDADCRRCHETADWKKVAIDHATLTTADRCDQCHATPRNHAVTKGDCRPCHTTTKWKPATFDHALLQPEEGCRGCHPLPTNHFTTPEQCASCHESKAWKPATFEHTWPMRHGQRRNRPNTCATCHPDNLRSYSCAACHGGLGLKMEHMEEGARFDENCVRCHTFRRRSRSGSGDGGKYDGGKYDGGKYDGGKWDD